MTRPERILADALNRAGISYQYGVEILGREVDFLVGNLVVEVDGKTYHSLRGDMAKNRILLEGGYDLVRFTADEVRQDRRAVVGTIQSIIKQTNG